jgi:hypothetical protein
VFPAAFGTNDDYIVGMSVKEDINYNETILYVPNKLLITVERALSSEIGFIFKNHDNIFKVNEDHEYLILILFILYEFSKHN